MLSKILLKEEKQNKTQHPIPHIPLLSVQTIYISSLEFGENGFQKLLSLLLFIEGDFHTAL